MICIQIFKKEQLLSFNPNFVFIFYSKSNLKDTESASLQNFIPYEVPSQFSIKFMFKIFTKRHNVS